jgi:hypothetical protein
MMKQQVLSHEVPSDEAAPQQSSYSGFVISLLREPSGQTRDLTNSEGRVLSVPLSGNIRSCVFIKNHINALLLLEF